MASAGHCDVGVPHNYNMLPATNPLQVLDTAIVQHEDRQYKTMRYGNVTTIGQTCPR